jgi:hypothetical protein
MFEFRQVYLGKERIILMTGDGVGQTLADQYVGQSPPAYDILKVSEINL